MILLTLSATMLLWKHEGVNVRIIGMREDGLSIVEMEPEYFSPPELGEREREVLEVLALHGGSMRRRNLVKYLKEKWNTSHVIVYRRLSNLGRKKLLTVEDEHVRILPLGLAVLEASMH